ncbi:uncharacterized protein LY89DRAFT_209467 [Mollisia scopiformis]|uniref:Uncharacterized protein n=1 Tax=Mollisia scopiformis TaxID=149040 RepID=A0A194WX17_MOLSC|nr:uncharacterized protein LY89DRAFT_209467 [Mollisia scopiformis]KUJ12523.1 hypothetical protein LY89DRAFT_209467 [Mollisia scopiformis]
MGKKGKRGNRDEGVPEGANESDNGCQAQESNDIGEVNGRENASRSQYHDSGQVSTADEPEFTLQPYTKTVFETTQSIAVVQKNLERLNELYIKHADRIQQIPKVHRERDTLRTECEYKNEKIRRQKREIAELKSESREEEQRLGKIREELQQDRDKLKAEKEKQVAKAEKADKSLVALKATLDLEMEKELASRTQQLEAKMTSREDERKKKLSNLEAEKKKQSDNLAQEQKKLRTVQADLDDNRAAKILYKQQKEELEATLKEIQNEFDLTRQDADFYKRKFADIASNIETISSEYFRLLPHDIHKDLKSIDDCFRSVPIFEEDTSAELRIAHVQRIMSRALYDNIWQPFSSDETSPDTNLANWLNTIYTRLAKNELGGKNGRAAMVWKVLTMRSLQSADQELPLSPTSPATSHQVSQFSSRASQAVQEIIGKLTPLVDPAQKVEIQEKLLRLAQSAVEVWNVAQKDKLKVEAYIALNIADRDTWRSAQFDPLPSSEEASTDMVIKSSTRPRVFTLFPRIIVQTPSVAAESVPHIPGSFSTSQQDYIVTETIIHPGIGLPESSALVIRGKYEEEQEEARQREIMENAKEKLKRRHRTSSRSGSVSGPVSPSASVSGPLSPSARWSKGSLMATQIED